MLAGFGTACYKDHFRAGVAARGLRYQYDSLMAFWDPKIICGSQNPFLIPNNDEEQTTMFPLIPNDDEEQTTMFPLIPNDYP
ncbi:hypothetical protein D8674_022676 [Pyrus ussuriensis x Pyrus communis]|uniref:Uncharacterized protein n=1 Tax=Pyrus ussuriensis x Pyrus communis TaxID=2448454 RepID=A0A5N5GL57_9ROSA|nr:hypothetical protein D8674_022676 [Pyrus ussuriensis x Pyrus communis]